VNRSDLLLWIISALDDNDGELDGNPPSLEERTALHPEISTKASKTGDPLFSAWNSQHFAGPDCKSTEHSQGRVNVRAGVEVGAPAGLVCRSGPLITCRSTSDSR